MMTSEEQPLTFKGRQERALKQAHTLLERHGCQIEKVSGGHRITGPSANLLITDLRYLYESDIR